MASDSYPNNAHNNRAISLAELEQLGSAPAMAGLTGYDGTTPVYADSTGRQVKLRAGVKGSIRGFRFINATETIIGNTMIVANTSGNPRIDLVVARLSRALASPNAYTIAAAVVTGTAAAAPVAPNPVRNEAGGSPDYFDIPLAEVDVPNGATSIASTQVRNRAYWITSSGYTGFSTAFPPAEPGLIFRANDTGVTYIGTSGGGWQRLYYNTGWKALPVPAGWSALAFHFNRCGDLVVMNARLARTGVDIPATTTPVFGALGEAFRPTMTMWGVYHCSLPDHSSHVAVDTEGNIQFAGTGTPGLEIKQNSTLFSNMVWPANA